MGDNSVNTLYTECCTSLRHYSQSCLQVRTLTVAQGVVVLGATGFLVRENYLQYSSAVAIFGLLLTAILWAMHDNYYRHFEGLLPVAMELEAKIVGANEISAPWSQYKGNRESRISRSMRRLVLHFGAFVTLILSLATIIVHNSMMMWVASH